MTYALWVLRQCDRFKCLPGAVEAEDAGLLRYLAIEGLVGGEHSP